jgi:hypothetical protein
VAQRPQRRNQLDDGVAGEQGEVGVEYREAVAQREEERNERWNATTSRG